MKLALVHKRFDRLGGAEWDCYESARQLAARGHDVHLVVGECRTAVPEGITVHRVPIVRAGQMAKLLSFALLAPPVWRRVGADVVIGYGRTVGHDLFRASGGCHRQYLVDLAAEGGALEAGRQWMSPYEHAMLAIERRQYRPGSAGVILAVSELARREILVTYPQVPPAAVAVLPYGVDVARFDPANRARHGAAIRRELGLSPEHPVVLTVGTGFRRKGVGVLLDVWKRAAPAGAALVVAGNDQHLAAWRRAARDLSAPVVFTGPRADVERLYAAADLFVLASVQEAFGMVVLEALAAGLPVVTSRMAGAAELLAGPLADLVVDDPRDPTALAAAIGRGLAPDNRAELGAAARAVAETHRLEDAVDGLERWCATLASGGPRIDFAGRRPSRGEAERGQNRTDPRIDFAGRRPSRGEAERGQNRTAVPYRVRCAAGPVPPEILAVDTVLAAPGVEILQSGSRATVAAVHAGGRELVLKRFRDRALEGLLLGSCAARAWRAAGLLRAARFPAPEMVAVLERRWFGLPRTSCTVAGRVQGVSLDRLWPSRRGKARHHLTHSFADYLRALHEAGVYPQDVRAANVLVTSENPPTFVLVDLDRVRAYRRVSWRRRRANVVQVLRSVGRRAPASERVRFLRRYLGAPSRDELRRRAAEILAVGRAKDAEYARRRGEATR